MNQVFSYYEASQIITVSAVENLREPALLFIATLIEQVEEENRNGGGFDDRNDSDDDEDSFDFFG